MSLRPLSTRRARRALLLRVAATAAGLAAAVLAAVVALLIVSANGPRWDAPLLITSMDCGEGICRDHPRQRRTIADAAGGRFEVVANVEGFRGADPPPPGSGVVVEIYGDSMIHGTGVGEEGTIARNLERALRARVGSDSVYVINYGMPMNYLVSSLRTYALWGRNHEPAVAIFVYHGGLPAPRDVNSLVQQIRGSWWMSRMFRTTTGRLLINRVQAASLRHYSEEEAIDAVAPGMELLARDQRDRGLEVVFFSFWSQYGDLEKIIPAGLRYTTVTTDLSSMADYRASPYVIAGDGHPNATGTARFADHIAAAVAPLVQARLE